MPTSFGVTTINRDRAETLRKNNLLKSFNNFTSGHDFEIKIQPDGITVELIESNLPEYYRRKLNWGTPRTTFSGDQSHMIDLSFLLDTICDNMDKIKGIMIEWPNNNDHTQKKTITNLNLPPKPPFYETQVHMNAWRQNFNDTINNRLRTDLSHLGMM